MSSAKAAAVLVVLFVVAAGVTVRLRKPPAPCSRPIPWSIGAVDPRFNLTDETLMTSARSATNIWNKAAGHAVFAFQAGAPLKINLVYDSREATATLGVTLAQKQASQDSMRNALDAMKSWFQAGQGAFNQEVNSINARGGATPAESQRLDAQKAKLNILADSIRDLAALYNERGEAINTDVEQFNREAGKTHQVGQYVQDSAGRRINVFKFIGDTELTRFLAHEFGHALGIDHNPDPESIMYEMNESGNLTPSAADLASLKTVCKL